MVTGRELQQLGRALVARHPAHIERFDVSRLEPSDPRGSVERLSIWTDASVSDPITVTVVNNGIVLVVDPTRGYTEYEVDDDSDSVLESVAARITSVVRDANRGRPQ
jgi:hypothetical protein